MTSIGATGYPLYAIKPIDTSRLRRVQASPEQMAEMKAAMEAISGKPVDSAGSRSVNPASNEPGNVYAVVEVDGKVVATLYNGGIAMIEDSVASKIMGKLTSEGHGPQLAQARAEEIAKALGGTIVGAPTAQTQEAWVEAYNTWYPQWAIDDEPRGQDQKRGLGTAQERAERSALFQAQLLAQAQSMGRV